MIKGKRRISSLEFSDSTFSSKTVHGIYLSGRLISLKEPISKAAVVFSKKVAKTAVQRNRVRRRVYAILENFMQVIPQGKGLVIYGKKEAIGAPFKAIQDDVSTIVYALIDKKPLVA
jgi:ribonuclease P protein component